jgi:hypothetical protein
MGDHSINRDLHDRPARKTHRIMGLLEIVDLAIGSLAIGVPLREIPDFIDFVRAERQARREVID